MRTRKIILICSIIIVCATIFLFSSQNGHKSESLSDAFAEKVIDKVSDVKGESYSNEKKKNIITDTRFLVRKGAHFGVYFVLGILVYLLLKCYNIKYPTRITIILCLIYACSDEIHQIFSPGRTARIFDVFVDTIGCTIGIILIKLIQDKILKKKKEVKA